MLPEIRFEQAQTAERPIDETPVTASPAALVGTQSFSTVSDKGLAGPSAFFSSPKRRLTIPMSGPERFEEAVHVLDRPTVVLPRPGHAHRHGQRDHAVDATARLVLRQLAVARGVALDHSIRRAHRQHRMAAVG